MEPRLTDIRESEALQYLGYRGGEIPPEIREALHRCRETVLKTARPRAVWRKFRYLPDGSLEGTDFRPLGRDRLRLRCSPDNGVAQRFYARNEFRSIGPAPDSSVPLELLEKYIGYGE